MKRLFLLFLVLCALPAWAIEVDFEGKRPSYSYQAADVSPAATATDLVCLVGSATKIVRVNRVQITADATNSTVLDFYMFKRTAANTGGTATQPAITKLDSSDRAATAVINLYSANPSALGAGTILAGDHYHIPAANGSSYSSPPWVEDFGNRNAKPLMLRSASESLCVGLNGQTIPAGASVYVRMEWTED